ncbi:MAG TPA: FAD-dependent oxidoreductase, partial [Ktedonobacteraceae bacterium]|nr:FAD-dependent oxidoreductase [Ktedonobacteraceae bacterium]
MFDKLFQPITIGSHEAKNRIIFGSHTTNFARNNLLSQQHADYYAARAEGGAGVVLLEEHIVHPSDIPYEYALAGYLPETVEAMRHVTQRIHAHGALAIVQLNHNGQQSVSDHTQRELWAPSAVPDVSSREVPKAMQARDIAAVIDGFALVARHAAQGQADGVELQIADRSLLRQFLSPLTNQRGDAYGGSLENRLRFVQETIEAVDAALRSEHILGVRLCVDELAPWAGITPEQGIDIACLLAETGRIDYLTITMGSIYSIHMFPFHASMHIPRGYAVHLAAAVKAVIPPTIPVFAAGRIMDPRQAEAILAEGQADGVEMIRALIADPDLPRLSRAGQPGSVRPCISCNQGCQVRNVMNAAIACNVNPDVMRNMHPSTGTTYIEQPPGRDDEGSQTRPVRDCHPSLRSGSQWMDAEMLRYAQHDNTGVGRETSSARPNDRQRSYLVVGGGPAGMEAARTLALRGRRVTLYEREAALGGAVTLAAGAPGRGELRLIVEYLQRQLEQLDVTIRLGVEVTAEMILAERPEAVIVATGARSGSGLLPIPGSDLPHVTDMRRVLRGEQATGQRIVVL